MIESRTLPSRASAAGFYVLVALLALICLVPMLNLLAVSLSSRAAASGGRVSLWPIGLNVSNYQQVIGNPQFMHAMLVSLVRVILGTVIGVGVTIITAYPLSRPASQFRGRGIFIGAFIIAMFFNGGMIPLYMVIRNVHMLDTIWALVIPNALAIFNVLLVMNFFRSVPKELEQAAVVDGANHWQLLRHVYIPLSVPVIATITLFTAVAQWNSWFDGLIYINNPNLVPLQTYLYRILTGNSLSSLMTSGQQVNPALMRNLSDRSLQAAQVIISTVPILVVYPFVQRYFIQGIRLGALKE